TLFLDHSANLCDLPSFPTRRSSDLTDELLTYSIAKMKEYGIVDSGDTLKDGIGAMNDARMASFFDKMVKAGVVKPNVDFRRSYRSEEHTSELQSRSDLVCRLLLEKK